MRHALLASTCLIAIAGPAVAETTISNTVTGPVRTSTIKNGAADDILINSTGIVNGSVLIDSNHKLNNQGTIQIGNVSNAVGVDVAGGVTSAINLSGKIIVDEPYTPTDADNDGDSDGAFALGSNRFGIRTNGPFNGSINVASTGSISVEGNDSAGIYLGGRVAGNFSHDGTTAVVGNNTLGIRLTDVGGDARVAGTVTARGQGAVAVRSSGTVDGALVLQGTIGSTGYRFATPPIDRTKLDADDLLQGGPAVSIEGNVARGIVLAVAPKDQSTTDNDEDKDGIEDAKEGNASITSYGAAPALRVGSANSVVISATQNTGTGFGLIVDGTVLGDGLYAGVNGTGVQIGGLGATVSIANGIGVTGGIGAKSFDQRATALLLGSGASTGELRNAGKILAGSGNTASSVAAAVQVSAGASLPTLRNSGQIASTVGEAGTAIAIVDQSGTLSLIENSGAIAATGAKTGTGRNVAIDLSANNGGASVRQTAVASTFAPPEIVGDVRFGSGSDTLDVADGRVAGDVSFGGGNNKFLLSGDATAAGKLTFGAGSDQIALSGTSIFAGAVDFGGGADTLAITGSSVFKAQLSNAANLAVSVQKGTFGVEKGASIASLNVSEGGTLAVMLDKTPSASSSLNVTGTASFGTGSKVQLNVANVKQAEGQFVVLNAGSLVGASNISTNAEFLPFLYKGSLSTTGNQLTVNIGRKSATELGLNNSETSAYSAIYTALGTDNKIGDAFLNIRDQETFSGTVRQMLPDHAGGTFEAATMGDRTIARALNDARPPYKDEGGVSYTFTQVAWGSSKSIGDTAGYKLGGWGAGGGAELSTKAGKFGATLSYLWGKNDDRGTANEVNSNQYTLAGHWRLQSRGLQLIARGSYSHLSFDGTRTFNFGVGETAINRTMTSKWNGSLVSGSASASQELWSGSFFVRPLAGIEYYRLSEDAHEEEGGGTALDLTVEKRKSTELAGNALLAAGLEFGGLDLDQGYFRLEAEAGRRQILSGDLGSTRARFGQGESFLLQPEDRKSGWVARVRAIGGSYGFRVAGEVGAEDRHDKVGLSARANLTLGL